MKLLVTGAGGVIGRQLIALAAEAPGIEVVAAGRRPPASLPDGIAFQAADLLASGGAAALIEAVRPTHLVHAAWETRQPTYWHDPVNDDWVAATAQLAEAFGRQGGIRFVQVGSCAEYDWACGVCTEDDTPSRPATPYGKAKLAAFEAVRAAAQGRFEAVEARVFFIYGPGEDPARFVPTICRGHIERTVPELGSGSARRDLLYAADAGSALLALATAPGRLPDVVNIGSGVAVPLADVARILARLAKASDTGLGRRPDRPGDPEILVADAGRLQATGWRPAYSLEAGLAETLAWWRRQQPD